MLAVIDLPSATLIPAMFTVEPDRCDHKPRMAEIRETR